MTLLSVVQDSFSADLSDMDNYPEAFLSSSIGDRAHAFDRLEEQVAKFTGEKTQSSRLTFSVGNYGKMRITEE